MKPGLIFSSALLALLAAPVVAWADANPDFDDDAKPILSMQPGLLQYVESRFDVKDTGTAKYPGDDDRRPAPPYIFRARPVGSHGPYNLRLLIQPGQPGHILGVVDITKVRLNSNGPAVASRAPAPQVPRDQPFTQPAPAPAPSATQIPELSAGPVDKQLPPPQPDQPATSGPVQSTTPPPQAPASQPTEPTADTPSGPIMDNGSSGSSNSGQPSLQPPPDPAPANQ